MKKLLLIAAMGVLSLGLNAQEVLLEKTYKPDSKANLKNLTELQVDKENNEIRMIFLTKSTEKKVKAEVLYFDMDYNFKKMENIEEDLDKVRQKFGLKFSLNACPEDKKPLLTIEANLSGQIVFKKGYIQRFLNWETGWCEDKFKIEERVKPKGDDGEKIKLVKWWTDREIMNYQRTVTSVKRGYGSITYSQSRGGAVRQLMDDDGNVIFIGMISDGLKDVNIMKRYTIQKFDAAKLEKVAETPLNFDSQATPLYQKALMNGNIGCVFQLQDGNYEYVEFDFNTQIVMRSKISNNNLAYWKIIDISEYNGDLYTYGPVYSSANTAKKATHYQIMKITSEKIEWANATPIAEMETKFRVPAGEKKTKPYTGKDMIISGLHVSAINGDILINGQSRTAGKKGMVYETIYGFHFNNKGGLKSHYSMNLIDKNEFSKFSPAEQVVIDAPGGKHLFWTVFEVAGMKNGRTLFYPRIAKIDVSTNDVSAFKNIGNRQYFLDDNFPITPLGDNNFLFLGASRKGKDIWFARIKME